MTFEVVLASGAAVAAMVSVAFGGGLFKRYVDHAKELAVTQHILKETKEKLEIVVADVAKLKLATTEDHIRIEQYAEHIKKLELIPELSAQMSAMKDIVTSVQSTVTAIASHQHSK